MNAYFSLFVLLMLCLSGFSQKSPKLALLIGISDYPAESGWTALHTERDIEWLQTTLEKQGFAAANIRTLQNEQATYKGIQQAFQQLLASAKKDATVVIHFSGHGQQLQDDKGDELDGLDEAWVPYDSPMLFEKGQYEGERLLRDDAIDLFLTNLRQKIGPKGHVLITVDACHSGTSTRGFGTARGTDIIMADSQFLAQRGGRSPDTAPSMFPASEAENLAPMVAIFAAGANELNYETTLDNGLQMGSLSFALQQAWASAKEHTTYRSFFERILLTMQHIAPRQTPQIEGTLSQKLLGGGQIPALSYFKISANGWLNERSLRLDGGTLAGLQKGTTLDFYPPETLDTSQIEPLASGKITTANAVFATVELSSPLSQKMAQQAWAFITQHGFGELRVRLWSASADENLVQAIQQSSEGFPPFQWATTMTEADLILAKNDANANYELLTKDGLLLQTFPAAQNASTTAYQVAETALRYLQCDFLRKLELYDSRLELELELQTTAPSPTLAFEVGKQLTFKIHNRSTLAAYYTILDIQPDNQVNVLIPDAFADRTAADFFIQPGATQEFELPFQIYPPTGTEVLKLIATREPLNLSTIVQNRGQTETTHPFEQLFANTFWYQNRGHANWSLVPLAHVSTTVFQIVEAD